MLEAIVITLVSFISGMMAIVTGGSFLIAIPSFIMLGIGSIESLALSRVFLVTALGFGSTKFFLKKLINWKVISLLGLGGLIGSMAGVPLVIWLGEDLIHAYLPLFIAVAIPLLFVPVRIINARHHLNWILPIYGVTAGIFASFGIAIGVLTPVFLMWIIGLQLKNSLANTRAMELVINIIVLISYLSLGVSFPISFALWSFIGAALGGWVGAHIVLKTHQNILKLMITLVGITLIASAFFI